MSSTPQNVRRRHRLSRWISNLYSLPRRVTTRCSRYLSVGRWGERVAARHLQRSGLILLRSNWRDSALEADLICKQHRTIVLVEVKTRQAYLRRDYPGRKSVTPEKLDRLTRLAKSFLRNNGPLCRRYGIKGYRIDIVEVYYRRMFGLFRAAVAIERSQETCERADRSIL